MNEKFIALKTLIWTVLLQIFYLYRGQSKFNTPFQECLQAEIGVFSVYIWL